MDVKPSHRAASVRISPTLAVAALMTVGLNTLFARSLFASTKMALFVGGALTMLYAFLFVVLQQQDYALLIGAIGLFIILALVMYFSRQLKQD